MRYQTATKDNRETFTFSCKDGCNDVAMVSKTCSDNIRFCACCVSSRSVTGSEKEGLSYNFYQYFERIIESTASVRCPSMGF